MGLLGSCVLPKKSHTQRGDTCPETGRLGDVGLVRLTGSCPVPCGGSSLRGTGVPWVTMSSQATLRAEKEEAPLGAEARGYAGTCDDTGWVTAWGLVSWLQVNWGALLNFLPSVPFWRNGT